MKMFKVVVPEYCTVQHRECVKFMLSALNGINIKEEKDEENGDKVFKIEAITDKHAELMNDLSVCDYVCAEEI